MKHSKSRPPPSNLVAREDQGSKARLDTKKNTGALLRRSVGDQRRDRRQRQPELGLSNLSTGTTRSHAKVQEEHLKQRAFQKNAILIENSRLLGTPKKRKQNRLNSKESSSHPAFNSPIQSLSRAGPDATLSRPCGRKGFHAR